MPTIAPTVGRNVCGGAQRTRNHEAQRSGEAALSGFKLPVFFVSNFPLQFEIDNPLIFRLVPSY